MIDGIGGRKSEQVALSRGVGAEFIYELQARMPNLVGHNTWKRSVGPRGLNARRGSCHCRANRSSADQALTRAFPFSCEKLSQTKRGSAKTRGLVVDVKAKRARFGVALPGDWL